MTHTKANETAKTSHSCCNSCLLEGHALCRSRCFHLCFNTVDSLVPRKFSTVQPPIAARTSLMSSLVAYFSCRMVVGRSYNYPLISKHLSAGSTGSHITPTVKNCSHGCSHGAHSTRNKLAHRATGADCDS